MGAEFLTASDGKYYYEVELLEQRGFLKVGFAGTNFGPKCLMVGEGSASWSFDVHDGIGRHRCVRG